MDEIVELSKSSADQADNIAEGIAKKLQHKSPIVKWKVCAMRNHAFMRRKNQDDMPRL